MIRVFSNLKTRVSFFWNLITRVPFLKLVLHSYSLGSTFSLPKWFLILVHIFGLECTHFSESWNSKILIESWLDWVISYCFTYSSLKCRMYLERKITSHGLIFVVIFSVFWGFKKPVIRRLKKCRCKLADGTSLPRQNIYVIPPTSNSYYQGFLFLISLPQITGLISRNSNSN